MAEKYVEKIKSASSGEVYTIRDANAALASDLTTHTSNSDIHVTAVEKATWSGKQDVISDLATIRSGAQAGATALQSDSLKTINNQSLLGSGNITIQGGSGTSDYADLDNKPQINSITLSGNKSAADLGLLSSTDVGTMAAESKDNYYTKTETDNGFLSSNQGSENSGKILNIISDGTVSVSDVKTVNNQSILGSGNISISGSGSSLSTHRVWIAPKKGSATYTTLVESELTNTLIGSDGLFSETFTNGNTLTYTHTDPVWSSVLVTPHRAGNFSGRFYLVSIFDSNNNLVYLTHGTTVNDVYKLELGDTIRCCSTSSFALYKLADADVFDLDGIGDISSDIAALQEDVTTLQTDVAQLQLDVIQPVYSELELENFATGWMESNGTIVTTPSGGKSQRCVVDGYNKIFLSCNTTLSPGVGWALYWFEDNEGNVITGSIQSYTKEQAALNPKVRYQIDVPTGAYYFRVTQQVSTVEIISESLKINKLAEELAENIGDLTTLTTTEKSSLVGAINEIDADVTTIQGQLATIDTTPNQWKGKKIVWMGTSIPAGQHSTVNYPTLIGTALGATVVNVAVPGCGVESSAEGSPNVPKSSGSFANTVAEYTAAGISSVGNKSYENAMLGKDADLYVFDYEPNNSRPGTELVANFNLVSWKYNDNSTLASHRDTYAGGMIYLIDQLLTEKPTAKIVMVSECVTNSAYAITANLAASKAIAEKFHIPLIELGSRLYYNGKNWSYYFHDYIHPNEAGHQRIANILMHELLLVG